MAMFAALGFVFAILPLLVISFILFARYRRLKNVPGDARVKLTNEVLSGIRIIKYYAWERPFYDSVDVLRSTELEYLLKMNLTLVFIVMLITSIPFVLPIVIFYAYTSINNQQLDIGKAFTTLALLGLVSGPMSMIPAFIQRYVQGKVSMGRINEFMSCDELEKYIKYDTDDTSSLSGCDIKLQCAHLSWVGEKRKGMLDASTTKGEYTCVDRVSTGTDISAIKDIELIVTNTLEDLVMEPLNRATNTLMNMSLSVKRGELVAVIGGVGMY